MYNFQFSRFICLSISITSFLFNAGCSQTHQTPKGPFDYVQQQPLTQSLKIPEQLNSPVIHSPMFMTLSTEVTSNSPIGTQVDIFPPMQIWSPIQGSRVIQTGTGEAIELTPINKSQDLYGYIWQQLNDFLQKNLIHIHHQDKQKGEIICTLENTSVDWLKSFTLTNETKFHWSLQKNETRQAVYIAVDVPEKADLYTKQAFIQNQGQAFLLNQFSKYLYLHNKT